MWSSFSFRKTKIINFYNILCVIMGLFGLLTLSGCPSSRVMMLKNASQHPISMIYSNNESKINVGKIQEEQYRHCFRIKSNKMIYEYKNRILPDKYFDLGVFSLSVNAMFTDDYKLIFYDTSNPNDFVELERGCSDYPYHTKKQANNDLLFCLL